MQGTQKKINFLQGEKSWNNRIAKIVPLFFFVCFSDFNFPIYFLENIFELFFFPFFNFVRL